MASDIKVTVSWTDDDGHRVAVPVAFRDGVSPTTVVEAVAITSNKMVPPNKPRIDVTKDNQ